jgi:hypothetical protein
VKKFVILSADIDFNPSIETLATSFLKVLKNLKFTLKTSILSVSRCLFIKSFISVADKKAQPFGISTNSSPSLLKIPIPGKM